MEVEWNYLYSLGVRPIIMLKCFIDIYVPVHYRPVFVLARILLRDCALLYTGQFYHNSLAFHKLKSSQF